MMDFKEIPQWWAICPGDECARREDCLRHKAFREVPEDVTRWVCVLPHARQGDACSYFQKAEKVRMARGFDTLFSLLRSRDARHDIRMELTSFFGSKGSYYRYRNGENQLTPSQQQRVCDVFRRHGFDGDIVFDHYMEAYDLTSIGPE